MITKRIGKQLAESARRFALNTIVYFNGKDQFRLDASSCRVDKPLLLILSKSCYQEQVETFPIKSAAELKQLLELQKPSGPLTRYFIGPYSNNQRLVYKIHIDPSFIDDVSRARALIPETLLLTKLAPRGFTTISLSAVATEDATQHLWYLRGPQQLASVLQGGVVQTEHAARVMLGVSKTAPAERWSFLDYLTVISKNWWRFPARWWLTARNITNREAPVAWPRLLGFCVSLTLIYALVSFSYLYFANEWRTKEMTNISSDVTQRLEQRQMFDSKINKLKALMQAGEIANQQLDAWNIIAFLQLKNIGVNQISANNQYLEFSGETESATQLVTQLNELPGVGQIEFISPVRRGRSGEMFRLRIELVAK